MEEARPPGAERIASMRWNCRTATFDCHRRNACIMTTQTGISSCIGIESPSLRPASTSAVPEQDDEATTELW